LTSPAIQLAGSKFHELEQKIQEFFNKINDVLSWAQDFISDDLIRRIQQGLAELRDKITHFWDRVNQLIDQPGNPTRLHQVAEDWVNEVGNIMGDVSGRVSLDKLQTNLDWEGRAAEAYKATVPAQVNGLNSVKDLADQLRSSLNNLGNGIESFWTAMSIAAGVFITGIVVAIASACVPGPGTLTAIIAVGSALGASLSLIGTAVSSMQSLTNTISTEQNNIAEKVHDLGDQWSKSNIGAMQDKSDWHVMQ
jgi:uncharacterized protein YukE